MKPKDEDKLRAIAEATFMLVEQTGLSGLTMAAIAREAGLATGTLYVYFKSKEELMVALYEQAKTATAASLMHGDDPKAPFRSRFMRMWMNWLEHRLTHYAEVVFIEQYYNSPWFGEQSRNLSARLVKDWVELIETAKTQQILKDVPTVLLINSFGGSVRETANLLRSGALQRTDAHLAQAFGLCWDGIKA
ncbi:TetR/AcrR family transcriptional regulator [Variovorax sp. J22P168]|uniref:TetR/AcrR family transcriptional regulator n=1 Tax=Variovorax jilinensis TaxID=3053513 RepID=UPI0025750091|nr:TetR/AcrR family transcriptional regulator [Variovorax sp. J22P168]MDM0015681.1 TetR/AcrR family transcriptional regulator [Variovorax sp. J22P168]